MNLPTVKPSPVFSQYGKTFSALQEADLVKDENCVARVEQSGSEGFVVEVIKWIDDARWERYAFSKFFDACEAKECEAKINENSGMSKVFHLMCSRVEIKTFTECRAITALCIQEFVLEQITSKDSGINQIYWSELAEKIGAYAMRSLYLSLAEKVDAAWEAIGGGEVFQDAFDWEFVPALLSGLLEECGPKFIDLPVCEWEQKAQSIFTV